MKTIQSNLLNKYKTITHAFTTKQNGNLAFHVNDNLNNVLENHKNLAHKLNYSLQTLVHMKQIHSNRVKIITATDTFSNPPSCDALITDKREIPLMVMVADCSPILFYDAIQGVIAVAHSGRAGAFSNIVQNVIDCFSTSFGSHPQSINAIVGPSICSQCYEVGSEILEEAQKLHLECAISTKEDKYYLDIRKILKKQLLEAGIQEENIEISSECNCCQNEKYYSYRANPIDGRFGGVIKLN